MTQASLTPRQAILYRHTCDVYRATITITDGKPGPKVYSKIGEGILCYFKINPNAAEPQLEGRVQSDFFMVQDYIHFGEDQGIEDADWLKNTTPNDAKNGQFWVVRGVPQLISNSGGRKAAYLSVKATYQEKPPPGVS